MPLHPAIQKCIEDTLKANVQVLAASGTDQFEKLLSEACNLFEQFAAADQVLACAYILGTLWATWQGETTDFERDNAMLITWEDRRALFCAMVEVVYKEASSATEQGVPDEPAPATPKSNRVM